MTAYELSRPGRSRTAAGPPWPTAAVWDAGVRLGVHLELPPCALLPVREGMRLAGPVRRIEHDEGVASILEGICGAVPGEVLLICNAGLADEACVGDLVALEAQAAGIAGLVVWGCHRDTAQLARIGLPVFSQGPCPASPRPRAGRENLTAAKMPGQDGDWVVADADGTVVVPAGARERVLATAEGIVRAERRQAELVLDGVSVRRQLDWDAYVERHRRDPHYTFREHLAAVEGALE
ncbi:RraA family protein [Streptomyces sp. NPDC002698]|uniref:RraA family protein n=1 Tax=Streptomyces sp. NPDC002698 TaxID=3364660 RepID=UPI003678E7C4